MIRMEMKDVTELQEAATELKYATRDSMYSENEWDWDMDEIQKALEGAYARMESALKPYYAALEAE